MDKNQDHKCGDLHKKRNGRPTLLEQIYIQEQLWPYFEARSKPKIVVGETDINIKTVQRYFGIWREKYIPKPGPEFFINCRLSKGRTILKLDSIIIKLEERSNELDAEIKLSGSTQEKLRLYAESRKTQESLSKLYIEKNNLECTPTADVMVEIETGDLFKQNTEKSHVAA